MRVFITGSESTGKTELASALARHYGVSWVPEFARTYMEQLHRSYTYQDVEKIASQQLADLTRYTNEKLIFFDTGLIITKIWFLRRFNQVPDWFLEQYPTMAIGHYLLCHPDLPWQPDPVRENPHIRMDLDKAYEGEMLLLNCPYERVLGEGAARLKLAIEIMDNWLGIER